ncbi:Tim44/TimA family putative adaptor protein [Acetobacter papayae]|uniref:Tim44/TimA family putative adaptor protein n=1 Tax=Acetobacter papayae TaxID=1076592 RepID=UPI0034E2C2C5
MDAPVETPEPSTVAYDIPTPGTRVGQLLQSLTQQDATFAAQPFLANVRTVFPQVVMAYAEGNRTVLQTYLVPAVYETFDAAIKARDEAGEKQRTEIKALRSLAIEDVRLNTRDGVNTAAIDVRIVSDQISLVLDREGQPATGTDAVTEFSDLWTFERVMGGSGNGWRLAAARSA